MNHIKGRGFCDLNIEANIQNLKQTVLYAFKLGYETIALNINISDEIIPSQSKRGNLFNYFINNYFKEFKEIR